MSTDSSRGGGGPSRVLVAGAAILLAVVVVLAAVAVLFSASPSSSPGTAGPPPERSAGADSQVPGPPSAPAPGQSIPSGSDRGVPSPGGGSDAVPEAPVQFPAGERVNILLLGLDERPGQSGTPTRSDTIILVSIDRTAKRAAMISIPRDLYVEIPGFGHDKIGHANAFGDAQGYPGGGPALAKETVERNFGVEIDHFARIEFEGFRNLVDTIGGVTVDVERPIIDAGNPVDWSTGEQNVYIPAGKQHLNGDQALMYARSRYGDDDFGRSERQQRLLLAILDKASRFESVLRLPSMVRTLWEMVETDIPPRELLGLARLAREIDRGRIDTLVLTPPRYVTPFTGAGGVYYLEPKYPEIREGMARVMSGETASGAAGGGQEQTSSR
jgi:polyisoprenyl-teichoic acid--peptidoglycan teichoic acid transferase